MRLPAEITSMNSSRTLWAPDSDSEPMMTPAAAVAIAIEIIARAPAIMPSKHSAAPRLKPASMALAQIAQAAATFFLLGFFLTDIGFKWTLVIGAACWALLYLIYVIGRPSALVVVAQPLHGLAYVFFMIVGQIFRHVT